MLAQARAKKTAICQGICGQQPATKVVQVPIGGWFEDPPSVVDAAGFLLCDDFACDAKARQDFMESVDKFAKLNQVLLKQQCDNCTKIGTDMLRCCRCKAKYYCAKDCQKRAWRDHRRDECVSKV